MALINCPKCDSFVSDKAVKCINCGEPIQKKTEYCIECGGSINNADNFCLHCGCPRSSQIALADTLFPAIPIKVDHTHTVVLSTKTPSGMRTTKLVMGIFSMVLFIIIMFQSCATGVVNALAQNKNDTSGGAGIIVAFFVLIAGIVGVVTYKSKGGGIVAGGFYLGAAIMGFANLGTFTDLIVWSILSLIFGAVFIIGSIATKSPHNN